ncbi:unnamed protein product [Globisporangium polare]
MKVLAIVTLALLAVAGVRAATDEQDGGSVKRNLRSQGKEDDQVPRTSSHLALAIERLERVFVDMPTPATAMEAEKEKRTNPDIPVWGVPV